MERDKEREREEGESERERGRGRGRGRGRERESQGAWGVGRGAGGGCLQGTSARTRSKRKGRLLAFLPSPNPPVTPLRLCELETDAVQSRERCACPKSCICPPGKE